MKTPTVYVRFVIVKGEILAVFMRSWANKQYSNGQWLRTCYAQIGQHGTCYDGMEKRKRATPEQYKPLKLELEASGYFPLEII